MRLLIVTQAVDRNHPVLGFFHRWVEEFAKHSDQVHVIALQVGEFTLPKNVTLHSLSKEKGANRLTRVLKFLSYMVRISGKYDAVFVHMNPEYVVLAGWWWRVAGKKVALWYTHKSVDLKLRIAEFFAHQVFTASKESFRLPSKKLHVMGHGIDVEFWKPDPDVVRGNHFISVGRLSHSKRHDVAIRRVNERGVPLRLIGEGDERERLKTLAQELGSAVEFLGPLGAPALRDEYRRAAALLHTSETGSLDKVVLEAAACGCPVETTDPALKAFPLSPQYVAEHHSLSRLVPQILKKMN